MTTDAEFRAGRHEEAIETLIVDMREVKTDVAEIKRLLAVQAGERGAVRWVGHFLSALVGFVASLIAINAKLRP